ncbi:Proteasome subunit beta type-7 [Recurvomyces mirabilis]|nr:Proteasome subunit beta type-7 [Recurvomyces mirabilis]
MNHLPQAWGRPRDDIYGAYDHSYLPQTHANTHPTTHTQSPVVTGTSVLGLRFKDGVVLAADNLASYGSLARFTDVKRLKPFNRKAVVGFGGDVSDMQYLDRLLNSLDVQENYSGAATTEGDDGEAPAATADGEEGEDKHKAILDAKNLHTYLSKVLYKRRSDFNPLWNAILVAGLTTPPPPGPSTSSTKDTTTSKPTTPAPSRKPIPYLAYADLLGTTYSSPTLATGFGAHLAVPIMRRAVPDEAAAAKLSREEAVEIVKKCMKVLFYRDARSMNEYSLCVIDGKGVDLQENIKLEGESWAFAEGIKGYGTQTV